MSDVFLTCALPVPDAFFSTYKAGAAKLRRHRPEETAEYNIALAQNYTDAIAVRTHGVRGSNSCMRLVCGRFHNVLNDLNCSCPPCVSIAYNSFRGLRPGFKNI